MDGIGMLAAAAIDVDDICHESTSLSPISSLFYLVAEIAMKIFAVL